MAKKNSDTIKEVLRNISPNPQSAVVNTKTIRTWTKKHDDGSVETTTETKREFTIKPSKSGAKLGAIAGATLQG